MQNIIKLYFPFVISSFLHFEHSLLKHNLELKLIHFLYFNPSEKKLF
jgi:hypothetical protein